MVDTPSVVGYLPACLTFPYHSRLPAQPAARGRARGVAARGTGRASSRATRDP